VGAGRAIAADFLLQTLGWAGRGVLGVAAGVGVMAALPAVFGNLLPVHAALEFPWRSIAAGLGTGLLTTLLFCLPRCSTCAVCGRCWAAQASGTGPRALRMVRALVARRLQLGFLLW